MLTGFVRKHAACCGSPVWDGWRTARAGGTLTHPAACNFCPTPFLVMATPEKKPPSLKPDADDGDQAPPNTSGEGARGRHARKPSDIPSPGWWDILKRTYQQLTEDNLSIVAA